MHLAYITDKAIHEVLNKVSFVIYTNEILIRLVHFIYKISIASSYIDILYTWGLGF